MSDTVPTAPELPAYGQLFALQGQVALVTGAYQGLGLEIARGLASFGAHVLLHCRTEQQATQAAAKLASEGLSVEPIAFDLADRAATQEGFRKIRESHGRLDVYVANAGTRNRSPLDEIDDDEFMRVQEVNVGAVFRTAKLAADLMAPTGKGRIIIISSLAGTLSGFRTAAYAASKGGVNALARSLAVELGGLGVRTNVVAPGPFATEINQSIAQSTHHELARAPLKRWGSPREIVGVCVFLASDASSFVTGQVINVDGGISATF